MTKNRLIFKLTKPVYTQLEGKLKLQRCCNCHREFTVGDKVFSKKSKSGVKWYCLDCVKRLEIWVK